MKTCFGLLPPVTQVRIRLTFGKPQCFPLKRELWELVFFWMWIRQPLGSGCETICEQSTSPQTVHVGWLSPRARAGCVCFLLLLLFWLFWLFWWFLLFFFWSTGCGRNCKKPSGALDRVMFCSASQIRRSDWNNSYQPTEYYRALHSQRNLFRSRVVFLSNFPGPQRNSDGHRHCWADSGDVSTIIAKHFVFFDNSIDYSDSPRLCL